MLWVVGGNSSSGGSRMDGRDRVEEARSQRGFCSIRVAKIYNLKKWAKTGSPTRT